MQKIDFFGGLHGNYLELLINVFIHQNNYDITRPIFTKTGACHLKNKDHTYHKIIEGRPYSYFGIPFNKDDRVVKIVPTINDMLIGLTNSLLRAGDQEFDLNNLEIDTIKKLKLLPKANPFLITLENNYGVHKNYPRHLLRNHFYAYFDTVEHGLEMFNTFSSDINHYYDFPFRAFFDTNILFYELNNTAKFLEANFYPTDKLMQIHENFLILNQGYQSEIKCTHILADIWAGRSTNIDLNLIEEAWINWQVARSLRCYDLPILSGSVYPKTTLEISQAIFDWKSTDYPTPSQ
jgi:hypothetical protein